ncbi:MULTISPECIES: histidine phosphatase family protein [Convivina]|uniref:Phosphoglycerate mutase GpmB n=2 Tax=Convivina TaxID=1697027 RepID=A0ABM9D4M5_9LACO|nr:MULTISPECIES: histidine phosphatase family protein [Convivina]SDB84100.1 probable phosphoglycerate mutase [Leuconostocaceae bacterium R-53105]PVY86485.1 putative phosphoglycerate mutase [Convivina intestini]CAH1850055.1 phosphoglycerate mutase GpmB [Convivina intestini]CAH1853395.1 phosphoglycerate mutase GpmB [Convivina sp. LMG 32447]CAH1854767.1 phosphoglycerate mutase GpmB [Convivina sp. LMG 32447]
MTDFYFVRHGQTEWNLERRFQGGQGDSPLLPTSYQDMHRVADYLKDVTFDHAYTSPLRRARVTAEVIVSDWQDAPQLSIRSNLLEVGLGQWEGELTSQVAKDFPKAYDQYRNHLEEFEGEEFDGEGYTAAVTRFQRLITNLVQQYPDGKVLLVAHGLILSFGLNALLGTARSEIRQRGGLSNTSTTILTTEDGQHFDVKAWNQTDYLNKEQDDSTTI